MNNTADIDYFKDHLNGKTAEEAFKNRLTSILESHETEINLKQYSTDNTLETTEKTIVGAINEVNERTGTIRTFDTIADAQAYTGFVEGDRIKTLGYYSKNDGAGHERIYSLTDDGSGAVVASGGFLNIIKSSKDRIITSKPINAEIPQKSTYKICEKMSSNGSLINPYRIIQPTLNDLCSIYYLGEGGTSASSFGLSWEFLRVNAVVKGKGAIVGKIIPSNSLGFTKQSDTIGSKGFYATESYLINGSTKAIRNGNNFQYYVSNDVSGNHFLEYKLKLNSNKTNKITYLSSNTSGILEIVQDGVVVKTINTNNGDLTTPIAITEEINLKKSLVDTSETTIKVFNKSTGANSVVYVFGLNIDLLKNYEGLEIDSYLADELSFFYLGNSTSDIGGANDYAFKLENTWIGSYHGGEKRNEYSFYNAPSVAGTFNIKENYTLKQFTSLVRNNNIAEKIMNVYSYQTWNENCSYNIKCTFEKIEENVKFTDFYTTLVNGNPQFNYLDFPKRLNLSVDGDYYFDKGINLIKQKTADADVMTTRFSSYNLPEESNRIWYTAGVRSKFYHNSFSRYNFDYLSSDTSIDFYRDL